VPAFIVNGKYLVDTTTAGGSDRVFKIIDFLISQERN
jgi:thiol:disulfide interchange protein DsbA